MTFPLPRTAFDVRAGRGLGPLALAAALLWLATAASDVLAQAAASPPAAASAPLAPPTQEAPKDFSRAERLLFMSDQLGTLKSPSTLHYSFRKSGSLEEAFTDSVTMTVGRLPDGKCCSGKGEFLTGARRMMLPDVEEAIGNPVTMYFLEHDVREMNRLTKGSQSYFRKMIRMAIYQGATVQDVSMRYQGRDVRGVEIRLVPFLEDPMRSRYERYVRKTYSFLLSDEVPGSVYGLRTRIADAKAGAEPLLVEELYIDGADAAQTPFTP